VTQQYGWVFGVRELLGYKGVDGAADALAGGHFGVGIDLYAEPELL